MIINNEKLITPYDFAQHKGISIEWAYRLIRRGVISRRVIAGRHFVIWDSRAILWQRKRCRKVRKQFE